MAIFSYLLTFMGAIFWFFRAIATLMYQLDRDFFAKPLIEYMDISELDLTEDMGLETLNLYDVYGLNNLHLEKNQKLDALLWYYTSKPQIASLDVSNNRQLSYLYISRAISVIGASENVAIEWYD